MIYLFLIACVCVYAFVPDCTTLGVTCDSLGYAFSYQFAHANWLHLSLNALSLVLMYKPIFNIYELRFGESSSFLFFLSMYLGSVIAALPTAMEVPTVGASGMVFFLLGALLALRPTKQQLKSYIFVAIAVLIQVIRGSSNVPLHLFAFAIGGLFIIFRLLCIKVSSKYYFD